MNLSFAGCGFLGIYHVGVAVCFKKYAPHLLLDKISGASAGALAACCLLCDMPLGEMTSDFFRIVHEARSYSLGPFSPSFNIQTCLMEGLQKFLPPNAHLLCNGKLHISLTRVYDGKNVIVSQFNSREDLLQALLCACFIPMFSGILPPRFHGVRYMDGAFSDNLPTINENTVTVSPFCGESDICPRDKSAQMFHVNWANTSIEVSKQNMNRFARILFPPKAETLSNMCQQGFDDGLRFLHRNNLINCTRCLAVQSTFVVSQSTDPTLERAGESKSADTIIDNMEEYDPECKECIEYRKNAKPGHMPETVLTVFQHYIEQANKGLMNWVFRHKLLTALPATALSLPADIFCATLTKIITITPTLRHRLRVVREYILRNLQSLMSNKANRKTVAASLSCQLAMRENGQSNEAIVAKNLLENNHGHLGLMGGSTFDICNENQLPTSHQEMSAYNHQHQPQADIDAFDHILQVSANQDAVYAYYYLDENNKVKVTEIFDMSESDHPALMTQGEQELNDSLEFDSDWQTAQPAFLFADTFTESLNIPDENQLMINFNGNDNEIDYDDIFDLVTIPPYELSTPTRMPVHFRIEEITNDEEDADDKFLQPEADQSFISDHVSDLLSKSSKDYSLSN